MVRIAALCVFPVYLSPDLENQPLKRPALAIRHFHFSSIRFRFEQATKSIDKIYIVRRSRVSVKKVLKEVAPRRAAPGR